MQSHQINLYSEMLRYVNQYYQFEVQVMLSSICSKQDIQQIQLERMNASRNLIGCAVILLCLTSTAHTLSLVSHQENYDAYVWVRGHNQVVNPCFKELPADSRTKLSWSKPGNVITITSCSDVPSQTTVRNCQYTLGGALTATGTDFTLGACSVTQQGAGCTDPVPGYLTRLSQAKTLELLSDRFNFRVGPGGKILFVTQNK